jgi:hypothetical protein
VATNPEKVSLAVSAMPYLAQRATPKWLAAEVGA